MPMIPLAEWAPDQPALGPYAQIASGVVPEEAGYRPLKSLSTTTNALTARCQGAAWFRASDGSTANFAGDATKLYKLSSTTWSDVSRVSGGTYAAPTDGNWRFGQFGTLAIAVNGVDSPQKFDLTTGTNWAALGGSPPIGTYITTVRGFVVMANIGSTRQRVQWSGIGDAEAWGSSATTQADYDDLEDGGEIAGLTGGEFGLIFQESAIRRMSYEGVPTVFRIDKIADQVGATIPNSVVGWGDISFFCHRSGFFMVQGGQQLVPIGKDKVDRWFWSNYDGNYLNRVSAGIDPVNKLYVISFAATGAGGTPNTLLMYHWISGRWSYASVTTEMIYSALTQTGYTLEQLDAFGTIDTLPYSLDSLVWQGAKTFILGGFYTDHTFGTFSGANLAAQIDTGDTQPFPGRRATIRSARPIVDGGSPTIAVGTRQTQQASVSWGAATSATTDGLVPLRSNGRYIRYRLAVPAASTWTWAQGIDDVDARPTGMR